MQKEIDIVSFKSFCDKRICLRKTFISKNCSRDSKRERCFTQYQKNRNDTNKIDERWEKVRGEVKARDVSCLLTKILTREEKNYLYSEQKNNLWLNRTVDCAHVLSRSEFPNLKYNVDNIILLGRLFHGRLDTYKNPLTGESITSDERDKWFERIMIENKLWSEGETVSHVKDISRGR